MAGIGLYGVLAFTIARRRWELGLRAALGARSAHLVSLVSGQAARQLGIGLAMGLALGWLASIPLTGVSFGSQPRDPWILVWVAGVVALVGAAATLTPARRALLANPAAIMRGT
jgi:ABC-type antimicrobial peptide transport system permease subunit